MYDGQEEEARERLLRFLTFVEEPLRRATWSSVATIVAYVDVPLVYFCVKWFRSLHQVQSTPETVHSSMIVPLRLNAIAMLFVYLHLEFNRTFGYLYEPVKLPLLTLLWLGLCGLLLYEVIHALNTPQKPVIGEPITPERMASTE